MLSSEDEDRIREIVREEIWKDENLKAKEIAERLCEYTNKPHYLKELDPRIQQPPRGNVEPL